MHIIPTHLQIFPSIKVISSNGNLVEWTIQTKQLLLITSENENRKLFSKTTSTFCYIKLDDMQKEANIVIMTDFEQCKSHNRFILFESDVFHFSSMQILQVCHCNFKNFSYAFTNVYVDFAFIKLLHFKQSALILKSKTTFESNYLIN